MASVQIFIKLLSGDMIPLEVAPRISLSELYDVVYHALPKDIQPKKVYPLQLLLPQGSEVEEKKEREEKEQKEEKGDTMLDLKENDVILILLLSETTYELSLRYISEAQDMPYTEMYDRYRITILADRKIVYSKDFNTNAFAEPFLAIVANTNLISSILPILPSMPSSLPRQAPAPISRDDLLADFHCHYSLRQHLLDLLEQAWKKEHYDAEHGREEEEYEDEDEDDPFLF